MSSKYIIEYLSDISDAVKGAKRVEQVNQSMASSLSAGYSNAVRVIGKNIDEIENRKIRFNKQDVDATIRKTGVAIQDTDGKFKQFNQTQTFVGDKLIKTKSSLKDVSGQFSKTEVETEKANKGFLSMGENIKRLVGRAALTIPVWIALRGTMQAVSKTMRDGAGALVDQDRAFQKAKRNIGGSASEIEANFNKLKKTAQEFSLKTGESVVNITTAFQRFKTTGLDYETSMAGALASTKTAVLLFGDTEQIANAVARSFRVLGGRTDEFGSKGAELESMLALIAELWKDNAFEIDEFANAIERLAPTAKNANVSLKESSVLISALHTAGIRGSRSTRLLSTAIIKMHKNFDQFGKVLGVNLKSTDSTFERLLLITDAIEKLHKADPVKASQAINDLFGIRAGESIKGLTALNSEIKKMIDISGDFSKLTDEFDDLNKQTFRQVEQFKNLRTEIGKAFISGVVGGEDFNDSLQLINASLKEMLTGSKDFGIGINAIFGSVGVGAGEIGLLFKDLITLDFDQMNEDAKLLPQHLENIKNDVIKNQLNKIELELSLDPKIKAHEDFSTQLQKAFKGKLSMETVKKLSLDLEFDKLNIDITESQKKQYVDRLKEILGGVNLTDNFKKAQQNAVKESVKSVIVEEDRKKIAEAVLKNELERLKTQGLLTSEVLKAEEVLRKQLSIEEKGLDLVEKRLEREKAIREEKELQTKVSSRGEKLFDIAKESGTDIAKKISKVLSGEVDFNSFVRRGGEAVDIFKKEFADIYKDQQAQAFFKGQTVPGEKGLKGGAGITLPIADEGIRNAGISMAKTSLTMRDAVNIFQKSIDKFDKTLIGVQPTGKTVGIEPKVVDPKIEELLKERQKAISSSEGLISNADLEKLVADKSKIIPEVNLSKQSMSIFEAFLPKVALGAESHTVGPNLFRTMEWDYGQRGQDFEAQERKAMQVEKQQVPTTVSAPVTVNAQIDISALSEVESKFMTEVSKQLSKVGSEIYRSLTTALTGKQNRIL